MTSGADRGEAPPISHAPPPPRRIPPLAAPNPWSRRLAERVAAGLEVLDLAETNPTRVGLSGLGAAERAALAEALDPSASYRPEPRGLAVAREAVAALHRERGLEIDAAHVVLTSGTSEGYAHAFRLLCEAGDQVLVPRPSYPLFEPIAALEAVEARPYRLELHGRWRLDLDGLAASLTARTRAVVVVQPQHPAGACLDPGERADLQALCAERGVAIVSDEVFADFPWPGAAAAPESLLGGARALTLGLGGISKACGLPQLKLGWMVAAGPAAARAAALDGLEWIADLFLSVATPVQHALPRLLAGRAAYRARVVERLDRNRARLDALASRRPEVRRAEADAGWAAMLRLPARRSDEDWALALLERGVAVHPGHFYDVERGAWLVPSLIVEPEIFSAGLDRLEELLAADD